MHEATAARAPALVRARRPESPEALGKGPLTHAFTLTFLSAAARDAYLPHPKHTKLGSKTVSPRRRRGVFDYDIDHAWGGAVALADREGLVRAFTLSSVIRASLARITSQDAASLGTMCPPSCQWTRASAPQHSATSSPISGGLMPSARPRTWRVGGIVAPSRAASGAARRRTGAARRRRS